MKTLILLAVALSGCGASTVDVEPVQRTSLVAGDPTAPLDCRAICFRVKPQLVRDFGVAEAQVDCASPAFAEASDCPSCQAVFGGRFGVQLGACP
jgi:hypothetical protein